MRRATRYATGSVVFDRRRKTWHLYTYENGKRRSQLIGTRQQYPTKSAAQNGAGSLRPRGRALEGETKGPLVNEVIDGYRKRKMPKRYSTRRAYESWIKNHIVPQWGEHSILDLQAMPIEDWILGLDLSPRSKGSIRGLVHAFWKYAIWAKMIPAQVNPINEVTIEGSSTRQRSFQSLTIEEGRAFLAHLQREPFRTIGLICLCFGLRISECLALRWSDVDWINATLRIDESIVRQRVGKPKTAYSNKPMPVDQEMLRVFLAWRHLTQFPGEQDWIFASPASIGRKPWSDDQVRREFRKAAKAAGIVLDPNQIFGTHSMRNSFRSWLDAAGASIAVQQKLMRHGDIRTTMNVYGDVVTEEMREAQSKVTGLALNSTQAARNPI